MYNDDFYIDDFDKYNQNKFDFFKIIKRNKKIIIFFIFIFFIFLGISLYTKNTIYLDSYEYLEEMLEMNEAPSVELFAQIALANLPNPYHEKIRCRKKQLSFSR